jgi:hypothetical protein
MLEHREERVRNRSRRFNFCIAFVLASAGFLLAQSDRIEVQQQDNVQLQGATAQPLLTAKLSESPPTGSASSESELPDAPSTAKPDTSAADPTASPAVRKETSQGARPAASGGPFGPDRSVADRNYYLVVGGMFAASVANAELTMHCLGKHLYCNDVPSSLKSRAGLYGVGIPADLAMAYLTYYLKRKHNRIWYVPAAAVMGANIIFGVRAFRWGQN